jgi:hypothetical protein
MFVSKIEEEEKKKDLALEQNENTSSFEEEKDSRIENIW